MPAEEKTEQATPKRKSDERKKGNVFKSQEIIILAGLLGVLYTLKATSDLILGSLTGGIEKFWNQAAAVDTFAAGDINETLVDSLIMFLPAAMPALLIACLVAIVVTFAQTRGLVSMKGTQPKFSRLSPLEGIKKIFSLRGIIELLKALFKIIILAVIMYNKYVEKLAQLPRLMEMEFLQVLTYGASFIMDIVLNVSIIFAFLAGADYLFQRWQFEKDLRMSKQEIKEEYKQTEGDPQIKAKIREKQRQMSQARMMQNVQHADVVVRNPTHYAVAIKYDSEKNKSPIVLAKGADLLALRIIKKAQEHGVMVMENKPLARGLYENVPLDREVPEEFFQMVAEVLAFVYNKQSKNPKTGKSTKV